MRVTTVNAARKPVTCGKCQTKIQKGTGYSWAKSRYGPKMIRCLSFKCRFRPSDLSSAKTALIEDAIEDAQEAIELAEDYESIKQALDDVSGVAEEVGQEYQDASDAWAGGQGRDEWTEKADACQEFASELQGWEYSGNTDEEEIKQEARDEEDDTPEQGETEEECEERIEANAQAKWEEELQAMKDEALDVLSSFSV